MSSNGLKLLFEGHCLEPVKHLRDLKVGEVYKVKKDCHTFKCDEIFTVVKHMQLIEPLQFADINSPFNYYFEIITSKGLKKWYIKDEYLLLWFPEHYFDHVMIRRWM
jgi:TusA-related sulfurtransferase